MLDRLEAPAVLCQRSGEIEAATGHSVELLRRAGIAIGPQGAMPDELWELLERAAPGEAVEWRPPSAGASVLGCTRYHCAEGYLVLMKEVSHKHAELSRRLHRQRLEATGRLVASVAHDLRNAVASIMYNAEVLEMTGLDLPREEVMATHADMIDACKSVRASVESLLGYARLGPSVFVPVSVREVMNRAQGFLRSIYRDGARQLSVHIHPAADWVQGNTLTIEQIFVNLLINAAEAAAEGSTLQVRVESELALPPRAASGEPQVCVRVWDNGPGVADRFRESIFQPFFSTREHGTGLGLTVAFEAAQSLGGTLVLEDRSPGACFAVFLPRGQAPE
ncbi:MAG TPA: ATP-binding protein [Polyangiales bacterium]|nr:ATP-binding protein [Polyangiales bacterium]